MNVAQTNKSFYWQDPKGTEKQLSDEAAVRELYARGKSIVMIARELHLTIECVRNVVK